MLVPPFVGHEEGIVEVAVEHLVEFGRKTSVEDDGIDLVVAAKGTAIEIGTADGAERAIDSHSFRVMESFVEDIDVSSTLLVAMSDEQRGLGC